MTVPVKTYPPLEQVTRPSITTDEIAYYTNMKPNTWRIHACKQTHSIRPFKVGGKLQWPTVEVKKLMGVA